MAWNRDKERKAGKALSIGGSIYAVVFLVIWNVLAASMGAWFMLLFGIPFLGLMIYRLVMTIRLAKDDSKEHRDPWDRPVRDHDSSYEESPYQNSPRSTDGYCPYCGGEVTEAYSFCPKCGRQLH